MVEQAGGPKGFFIADTDQSDVAAPVGGGGEGTEAAPEPKSESMQAVGMPSPMGGAFIPGEQYEKPSFSKEGPKEPAGFFIEPQLSSEFSPSDIAKGAVSGAYEVKRLPQMAGELVGEGLDALAYKGFQMEEKAGKIPSADEAYADWKLAQEEAWKESGVGRAQKAITETLPYYGYQPQTRAGAIVKEAVTSGAESAVLPFLRPAGALAGAGYGAVSGASGEIMRQKFEGTPYEPFAQFLGAMAGQILGEGVIGGAKQFFKARGTQEEIDILLEKALKQDAEAGLLKMSPEELADRLKSKEPLSVGEVLKPGAKTTDLLEKLITRAPGTASENFIASTLGDLSTTKILNGGQLTRSAELAAEDEAKRVFDILRANPVANDIMPNTVGKITQNDFVKKAMERVARGTENVEQKEGFEIIAPSFLSKKENVFTYGPAGSVHGGNLNYWHAVKKEIDNLYELTGNPRLLDVKRDLINGIDNAIGGEGKAYSGALAESAAKYGDLTSVKEGYKLMGDINSLKMDDIIKKTANMTPDQLDHFKDGVIARIYEKYSEKGGPQKFLNDVLGVDPKVPQKLIQVLGEEAYSKIAGAMTQQNIIAKVEANKNTDWFKKAMETGKSIALAEGKSPSGYSTISAIASGIGAASGVAPIFTVPAFIASGLFAGRQYALNKLEREIAPQALKLLSNPEGGAKLAELALKDPNARSFLRKLDSALTRGASVGAKESIAGGEPELEPIGMPSPNANGGRIAYKSGGRVKNARAVAMSLLREIDQTRKMIGKRTEDILSMPDDAVATALTIARGNV